MNPADRSEKVRDVDRGDPAGTGTPAGEPQGRTRGVFEVLAGYLLGRVGDRDRLHFAAHLKTALRRPVPRREAWRLSFSAVTVFLLVLAIATGCLLDLRFVPTDAGAHASLRRIDQLSTLGWMVRQIHLWTGRMLLALVAANVVRMFLISEYKTRGRVRWIAAFLLVGVVLGFMATGTALPGSRSAVGSTRALATALGDAPLVGGIFSRFFSDTPTSPGRVVTRSFVAHVVILPWVLFLLVIVVYSTLSPPPAPAAGTAQTRFPPPLWPDRILETATAIVLAFGGVLALSVVVPRDLGPAGDWTAAGAGSAVEPALRIFTGIEGLFGKGRSLLAGPVGAWSLFLLIAGTLFALPFFDKGPTRYVEGRRRIVLLGSILFAALFLVALLGSRLP